MYADFVLTGFTVFMLLVDAYKKRFDQLPLFYVPCFIIKSHIPGKARNHPCHENVQDVSKI